MKIITTATTKGIQDAAQTNRHTNKKIAGNFIFIFSSNIFFDQISGTILKQHYIGTRRMFLRLLSCDIINFDITTPCNELSVHHTFSFLFGKKISPLFCVPFSSCLFLSLLLFISFLMLPNVCAAVHIWMTSALCAFFASKTNSSILCMWHYYFEFFSSLLLLYVWVCVFVCS